MSDLTEQTLPLPGLVTRFSTLTGSSDDAMENDPEPTTAALAEANVVTSEVDGHPGRHKVVLDIDMPVTVLPSSTEGHHHLYIDAELSWEDYQRLIWVLADLGIVEEGYASASHARGYTVLRLPWVHKDDDREATETIESPTPQVVVF